MGDWENLCLRLQPLTITAPPELCLPSDPPGPALTLLTCWFPILITHGLDPHHRVTSDPRHRIAVAHRALTADARSVNGSCCFVIVFIVCRHTWLTPDPRSPGKHTHGQGVPQAGLLGPAELGTEELSPPFAG